MARTLGEIRASRPAVDHAKLAATSEEDICRYAAEDGSEAAAPLAEFKRQPGQRGKGKRPAMVALNVRVSPETLEAFKLAGDNWRQAIRRALDAAALDIREGGRAGNDNADVVRRRR